MLYDALRFLINIVFGLLVYAPVYALTRRLLRPREWVAREVRLLG